MVCSSFTASSTKILSTLSSRARIALFSAASLPRRRREISTLAYLKPGKNTFFLPDA
jgi:hypothetical protein